MAILYIVSTPIGHLKDVTIRALEILGGVDLILCEDTRVTQKLLNHFNIKTRTLSYHQHSKLKKVKYILELLGKGKNLALVSDAGTPGVSDPGNKLVEEVVKLLGKIVYAYLGVYYTLITEDLQQDFELSVDYGAWVGRDQYGRETDIAVIPDSAAKDSGLERDDILIDFNGEKVTVDNSLAKIIQRHSPGDRVILKVLRDGEEKTLFATLGERED